MELSRILSKYHVDLTGDLEMLARDSPATLE
jgi:hypothetical protein